MEAKEKINNYRSGLIDGLPNSFEVTYVLKMNQLCHLCEMKITEQDIDNNEIICSEEYYFYHKKCLSKRKITYVHQRANDKSSTIRLLN